MYISPDNRINPPPTTVDGKYVAEHMGMALTMALADIAERRPLDPIEYLAQWLYKYQETMEHNKKVIITPRLLINGNNLPISNPK